MLYGTLYEGDPSDPGQPLASRSRARWPASSLRLQGRWIRYVAELIPENAFRDGLRVPLSVFATCGHGTGCKKLERRPREARREFSPSARRCFPAAVNWRTRRTWTPSLSLQWRKHSAVSERTGGWEKRKRKVISEKWGWRTQTRTNATQRCTRVHGKPVR